MTEKNSDIHVFKTAWRAVFQLLQWLPKKREVS